MANAYLDAVYALQLPAGQKTVLVALANRANKAGECFPSIRCMTLDTGLARSTVISHINKLVEAGHVAKSAQYRKDNSRSSNLYKVVAGAVKATKKAAKRAFTKAVEMGKEFTGKPKMPAPASLKLEYDNGQWIEVRANIFDRVMELYPNANPEIVMDSVEGHLEFWMNAAQDNRRLRLSTDQLRAKYLEREREFLEFLNNRALVIDPVDLLGIVA